VTKDAQFKNYVSYRTLDRSPRIGRAELATPLLVRMKNRGRDRSRRLFELNVGQSTCTNNQQNWADIISKIPLLHKYVIQLTDH
jgi:hypothetical protein